MDHTCILPSEKPVGGVAIFRMSARPAESEWTGRSTGISSSWLGQNLDRGIGTQSRTLLAYRIEARAIGGFRRWWGWTSGLARWAAWSSACLSTEERVQESAAVGP